MGNTNLLEGVKCPRCGNDERLRIAGTVWLDMTDDGTVPSDEPGRGDHEWDGDSIAECPKCDYMGRFAAFHGIPRGTIVLGQNTERMAEAAKRDPAVQAVRRDLDGERITKLEAKAAHFDLALDNLLHHATVRPAGSPKQVRDMICDAVTDANRGVNSETRMRREP
ncbi:MAG: hypothetical protein OXK74_02215 [Gemmatimonadota bacterium]|nr:hypothetical protein [Gemmatimonadota bacterium]